VDSDLERSIANICSSPDSDSDFDENSYASSGQYEYGDYWPLSTRRYNSGCYVQWLLRHLGFFW
jgi:hypothetical protein